MKVTKPNSLTEEEFKKLWGETPTPDNLEDPMEVNIYSYSRKTIKKGLKGIKLWLYKRELKNQGLVIVYCLYYTEQGALNEIEKMETKRGHDGSFWIPVTPIVGKPLIEYLNTLDLSTVSEIRLLEDNGNVAKIIKIQ